jgi:hypothetical protein
MSNRSISSAEVKLTLNATINNALNNGANVSAGITGAVVQGNIDNGVGDGEANRAWDSGTRELAEGANETLDLYTFSGIDIGAGSGNDGLGQALVMEEIVAIIIHQVSGAGRLQIEPGTSNPLTALGSHTVATDGALRANGTRAWIELGEGGIDLSASKKNVKFTASGGAVAYRILILGRHDDDESTSSSSLSSTSSSSLSSSSSSASSSSSS